MLLGNIGRLSGLEGPDPRAHVEGLVDQAREGRHEAFGRLYEEYAGRIFRYIYARTGQTEPAEDLTQEVFLRAFTHMPSYRPGGTPFFGWLVRIARNLVVDHYRRSAVRKAVPLPDDIQSPAGDPVSLAETHLETARLFAAIKDLTPAQREALSLRFAAGLSITETAATMGRSEGAVKALQHAAVARLRVMMDGPAGPTAPP